MTPAQDVSYLGQPGGAGSPLFVGDREVGSGMAIVGPNTSAIPPDFWDRVIRETSRLLAEEALARLTSVTGLEGRGA